MKQEVTIKKGDCIFFKRAKHTSSPEGKFFEFVGHGFGVYIGHIPNGVQDPTPNQLLLMMGSTGFISFDDISEFLGEDVMKSVIEKFLAKYNTPQPVETPVLERPKLVDLKGNLLEAKGKPLGLVQ